MRYPARACCLATQMLHLAGANGGAASPMPLVTQPYRFLLDDIDAAGVVFGPRLIAIAHRAAEEALAEVGLDFAAVLKEGRIALPIVKIDAEFRAPIHHGDQVNLGICCTRIGGGSFTMTVTVISATGQLMARISQIQAAIDLATGNGMTLPLSLRNHLVELTLEGTVPPPPSSAPTAPPSQEIAAWGRV